MSYKDKENNNRIESDDLNIKSHLNTSLDLSGISVSEDLINRTLTAIKEQSAKEDAVQGSEKDKADTTQSSRKIIQWSRYVRGAAGVAAALLVVMIGYAAIRQFPIGMKKSDSSTQQYSLLSEDTASDAAAPAETAAADNSAAAENSTSDTSEDTTDFTITAEPFADTADTNVTAASDAGTTEEAGTAQTETAATSDNTATTQESEDMSISSDGLGDSSNLKTSLKAADGEGVFYTFRDIFVPSPELAEYITITDNNANASITLTDQADILDFYTLMDDHQFTGDKAAGDGVQTFTVEMNSPSTQTLYTMLVGDYLTLRYTQGDTTTESIYYAVDPDLFQGDVETFYLEHSN